MKKYGDISESDIKEMVRINPDLHSFPAQSYLRNNRSNTGKKRKKLIAAIFERDGNLCRYCQRKIYPTAMGVDPIATIDHYVPLSKGGANKLENMVAACQTCNNWKADQMPDVFLHWMSRWVET